MDREKLLTYLPIHDITATQMAEDNPSIAKDKIQDVPDKIFSNPSIAQIYNEHISGSSKSVATTPFSHPSTAQVYLEYGGKLSEDNDTESNDRFWDAAIKNIPALNVPFGDKEEPLVSRMLPFGVGDYLTGKKELPVITTGAQIASGFVGGGLAFVGEKIAHLSSSVGSLFTAEEEYKSDYDKVRLAMLDKWEKGALTNSDPLLLEEKRLRYESDRLAGERALAFGEKVATAIVEQFPAPSTEVAIKTSETAGKVLSVLDIKEPVTKIREKLKLPENPAFENVMNPVMSYFIFHYAMKLGTTAARTPFYEKVKTPEGKQSYVQREWVKSATDSMTDRFNTASKIVSDKISALYVDIRLGKNDTTLSKEIAKDYEALNSPDIDLSLVLKDFSEKTETFPKEIEGVNTALEQSIEKTIVAEREAIIASEKGEVSALHDNSKSVKPVVTPTTISKESSIKQAESVETPTTAESKETVDNKTAPKITPEASKTTASSVTVSKKKKAVATNEDKLYTPVEKEEYTSIVEDLYEEVTEKLAELKGTKKPKTEILIQDKVDNLIGAVKNKEYHSAHKNNKLRKVIRDSYTPTEEAKTPFLKDITYEGLVGDVLKRIKTTEEKVSTETASTTEPPQLSKPVSLKEKQVADMLNDSKKAEQEILSSLDTAESRKLIGKDRNTAIRLLNTTGAIVNNPTDFDGRFYYTESTTVRNPHISNEFVKYKKVAGVTYVTADKVGERGKHLVGLIFNSEKFPDARTRAEYINKHSDYLLNASSSVPAEAKIVVPEVIANEVKNLPTSADITTTVEEGVKKAKKRIKVKGGVTLQSGFPVDAMVDFMKERGKKLSAYLDWLASDKSYTYKAGKTRSFRRAQRSLNKLNPTSLQIWQQVMSGEITAFAPYYEILRDAQVLVPDYVKGVEAQPIRRQAGYSSTAPAINPNISVNPKLAKMRSPHNVSNEIMPNWDNPVFDYEKYDIQTHKNTSNMLEWVKYKLSDIPKAAVAISHTTRPLAKRIKPLLDAQERAVAHIKYARQKWENADKISKSARRIDLDNAYAREKLISDTIQKEADIFYTIAMPKLAAAHSSVRIMLAMTGKLNKYKIPINSVTPKEWKIAKELREYFKGASTSLKQRGFKIKGLPVSGLFARDFLFKDFESSMDNFFANKQHMKLNPFKAQTGDVLWFPDIHTVMESYIPVLESKIAKLEYDNRWSEPFALMHESAREYYNQWLNTARKPYPNTVVDKLGNAFLAFEYAKTIGLMLSVAFKHFAPKLAGTIATHGAEEVGYASLQQFRIIKQAVASHFNKDKVYPELELYKHYNSMVGIVGALNEIPSMSKLLTHISGTLSAPTTIIEMFDNGVSLLSTITAAAKNLDPIRVDAAVRLVLYDTNFRLGHDRPLLWNPKYHNSSLARLLIKFSSMFQTQPYKATELKAKWLENATANYSNLTRNYPSSTKPNKARLIKEALYGKKNIFGDSAWKVIVRWAIIVGAAEYVARQYNSTTIEHHIHTPYASIPHAKEGFPYIAFGEPKVAAASTIIGVAADLYRGEKLSYALPKHLMKVNAYDKFKNLMEGEYNEHFYANPIAAFLSIPKVPNDFESRESSLGDILDELYGDPNEKRAAKRRKRENELDNYRQW